MTPGAISLMGRYEAKVEEVRLVRSKSGIPMLRWKLTIAGPTYHGWSVWKHSMLSADKLGLLKTDLKLCGVVLGKLSDLPSRLGELIDLSISVTLKTSYDYQRVYLNHVARSGSSTASVTSPNF
jgi:hypothetical protein